jgi:preprotein translocase subunit SecE
MSSEAQAKTPVLDWGKWIVAIGSLVAAIYGNYVYGEEVSVLYRTLAVVALFVVAVGVALTTTKGKEINQLRQEAWIEIRRVVWPTRQETVQTTLIVILVVVVCGLLLWLFDTIIRQLMSLVI